jgi:hypothetical protein
MDCNLHLFPPSYLPPLPPQHTRLVPPLYLLHLVPIPDILTATTVMIKIKVDTIITIIRVLIQNLRYNLLTLEGLFVVAVSAVVVVVAAVVVVFDYYFC